MLKFYILHFIIITHVFISHKWRTSLNSMEEFNWFDSCKRYIYFSIILSLGYTGYLNQLTNSFMLDILQTVGGGC